jgi:hypothetical protein
MRLVSVLALVGFGSGCSDGGDAGMFVLNNTAPPVGTICTLTGASSQGFTSAGTISYFATEGSLGYVLAPLIESRITTTSLAQVPQRTIHLEGANITAQVNGAGAGQQYTALFAGSLLPDGTTNVSFDALPVDKIMALGSKTSNTLVVLTIQIYGTLGGSRIDADTFQYPVTIVAEGKGIVFGAGDGSPAQTGYVSCKAITSVTRTGNACNPLQDGVVDCCRSQSGSASLPTDPLQCPAIPQ